MTTINRAMATIRKVVEINPIEGADAIESVRVDGWRVVCKKGEFAVEDAVIFCEIDSWIPYELAPFLSKGKEPHEYNGVKGERLKTVKLRGSLSQGLLLPIGIVHDKMIKVCGKPSGGFISEYEDVSELLNIQKWEPPFDKRLAGNAKGSFPSFLQKTDQERVQNVRDLSSHFGETFEVSIKLDGSSCTVYHNSGEVGVCSRNIDLKEDDNNAFWAIAKQYNIPNKLKEYGKNIAVQGELIAPSIQSNHEQVTKPEWYCFSVFDIDSQECLRPAVARFVCKTIGIPYVPVLHNEFWLEHSVQELLDMAEGDGMNKGVKREGLVFKSNSSQFSFKAVSNSYLLKKK